MHEEKSSTDLHWDAQATRVEHDTDVNIQDIYQRELEFGYIVPLLSKEHTALEIGCGNGFSTNRFREHLKHVDAFDYSESMVRRAIDTYRETNNTFFRDDILHPMNIRTTYDIVLCIRVLINLKHFEEQKIAIENISTFLKPGGILILVEGFSDGFRNLNALRNRLGMMPVVPASINCYSELGRVTQVLEKDFRLSGSFHLGHYDFLTRIYYPLVVGEAHVRSNSAFSQAACTLARHHNPDIYEQYSRIRGLILEKT